MDNTDGNTRTLYPYETRRRGRWRFGDLVATTTLFLMTTLIPVATADPADLRLPEEIWTVPFALQTEPSCTLYQELIHTTDSNQAWVSGPLIAASVAGTVSRSVAIVHCQPDDCFDAYGGHYRVIPTGVRVTVEGYVDLGAHIDPMRTTKGAVFYHGCGPDTAARAAAEAYAGRTFDYSGTVYGTIGSYDAIGHLKIDYTRSVSSMMDASAHTLSFEGVAGHLPAKAVGGGADLQ